MKSEVNEGNGEQMENSDVEVGPNDIIFGLVCAGSVQAKRKIEAFAAQVGAPVRYQRTSVDCLIKLSVDPSIKVRIRGGNNGDGR
jgi:hypothetical protein